MIHIYKMKKAFTMIELVFAIVVIGILASLAMPRIDRDLMSEAATNILSDIRYTQHLALMDNKHEWNNLAWQGKFWTISFRECNSGGSKVWYETVFSDADSGGNVDANESALDPSTNLSMNALRGDCSRNDISPRMLLTKKYGIKGIKTTSCKGSTSKYIGFDYFGRPHRGYSSSTTPDSSSYIPADCTFTFTMSDGLDFNITIQAETGYASINGQPDS